MRHPEAVDEPMYVIVVPASQPGLYDYLRRRFSGDRKSRVVLERRAATRPASARRPPPVVLFEGVTVVRRGRTALQGEAVGETGTCHGEEEARMEGAEVLDDRQRVDRWLEESQYMLGRMVPGYLDDRERLKLKLMATEQDCDRLRLEIDELRREIAGLQSDVQFYRNEQGAAAEALAAAVGQLSELQRPLAEFHRRLQNGHPAMAHV